jgi:ABC-2 type transport system permease protein
MSGGGREARGRDKQSTAALVRSGQQNSGGYAMNATVRLARAEFRKLFTTLAVPVTVALAVVFAVGSVLIDAAVAGKPGQHPLGSAPETYQMLKFGPIVVVAMLILGILVAGGEFRHRTIVPTLLATPRRARVFAVKVAVIALFGAVFSAVIFGLGLGTIAGVLAAHGMHTLPAAAGRMYVGTVIAGVCFGMIGVALGALTRNTFVAIIAAVGWALFVEVIALGNVAPSLAKWFPVWASIGLTNPPEPNVLAPAVAGLVLAGYAVAMLVAASRTTIRRDIV